MSIKRFAAGVAGVFAVLCAGSASADHDWNNYHWAKNNQGLVQPPVGVNLSGSWLGYVDTVITDWNKSAVIDSARVAGSTAPKTCKPVAGTIQLCNATYGRTGWLGIAQIWLSNGHISQAVTKLNDTYYNTAQYNTAAWRRLVFCQEVGHNYGLGHTNEIFTNYNDGTCMDYTNAPAGGTVGGFNYGPSNEYPNQHDYDMLAQIYGHADATNFAVRSVTNPQGNRAVSEEAGGDTPAQWGRPTRFLESGRPFVFEQDLGGGRKKITHVFWLPDSNRHDHHEH